MLDATMLGGFLRSAHRDLFRLETRDFYDVPTDGGDYGRYLSGEPGPDAERKAAWHERLRSDRAQGVRRWRVHAVTEPLTDYLRFEFEWGHAPNAALEEIRVLTTGRSPAGVALCDFWFVDDRDVLLMHYDETGKFTGAQIELRTELPRYRAIRAAAWESAEPFTPWWEARPQYHRRASTA